MSLDYWVEAGHTRQVVGRGAVRLHEADISDGAALARLFDQIAEQDGPEDVMARQPTGRYDSE